jgi:putative hydrolase of the HAD superfamily
VLADVKALIFDLDGTLYVSSDLGKAINLSACEYLAELKGVEVAVAECLIRETKQRLSAASGLDTTLSRACMELGVDIRELHRRFAEEIDPFRYLRVDGRVVELLKILRERYEFYIYTNNNRSLSERVMAAIGVAGMFRKVFTIEDSWRPKPDRRTLEEILAGIGACPEECLFVGDRYDIDLRLPAAMGCAVFLATTPEELLNLINLTREESP